MECPCRRTDKAPPFDPANVRRVADSSLERCVTDRGPTARNLTPKGTHRRPVLIDASSDQVRHVFDIDVVGEHWRGLVGEQVCFELQRVKTTWGGVEAVFEDASDRRPLGRLQVWSCAKLKNLALFNVDELVYVPVGRGKTKYLSSLAGDACKVDKVSMIRIIEVVKYPIDDDSCGRDTKVPQ